MTREEARQNLIALGIEEPTDAQVTNYLNQFHNNRGPVQSQTQQQLQQLQQQVQQSVQPPTLEPASEELQNALNRIQELERENARKDILAYASSKGLSGDQIQNILNAFGENVDTAKSAIDSMAQIISDNRAAAAQEKEQELARNASNPGGGNGGNGSAHDEKPADIKNAESITFGGLSQNAQSARDFYK